jgi:hypothetical protein
MEMWVMMLLKEIEEVVVEMDYLMLCLLELNLIE